MSIWQRILGNQVLVSSVMGWTAAQIIKTIIDCILNKNFNAERLFGSGGMPSSHSATVCSLTVAAGLCYGPDSFEFAVSFVLAMIVMYDAMGVRRETGKQARLLNTLLLENPLKLSGEVLQERLKEYVGHTPLQVFAGAVLGIGMTFGIDHFFY
ncbi:MAG: divergent PAP2 family protein [Lachnospiraceae bacterium]|jgi:acid phosphatase family membrane protein YuiD|nr:divergent PAP2 family protein [Lachnospiraceae bacterium]